MREIKFRAWDNQKNKMVFMFEETKIVLSETEWEFGENEQDEMIYGSSGSSLMQFVELKDKNGKEIFEGDIIKRDWKADGSLNEGFDLFVCELQGQRWLHSLDGNEWSDIFEGKDEIIGNKFENPELLEGKK